MYLKNISHDCGNTNAALQATAGIYIYKGLSDM